MLLFWFIWWSMSVLKVNILSVVRSFDQKPIWFLLMALLSVRKLRSLQFIVIHRI